MKQAMILAAGLGTRLKPLTDSVPKALVSVGGQTLLDRLVMKLRAQGYSHLVINVHHLADQIEQHVAAQDFYDMHVDISDEREELLETGGALKKAAPLFDDNEPILIHNVDILDNVDYDWFRRQHLDAEDAILLVSRRKTQRYLLFDNAMRLMGWVNVATGEIRSPYEWVKNPKNTRTPTLAKANMCHFSLHRVPVGCLMELYSLRNCYTFFHGLVQTSYF